MTRPTKHQLEVWHAVVYDDMKHVEAKRRLKIKKSSEAAFLSRMLTYTKYLARTNRIRLT